MVANAKGKFLQGWGSFPKCAEQHNESEVQVLQAFRMIVKQVNKSLRIGRPFSSFALSRRIILQTNVNVDCGVHA